MPSRVRITSTVEQQRDRERRDDDGDAIGRIVQARQDRHRGVEPVRQRHPQARRPPDDPHQLIEEQDQPEGAEHMIEMVAPVERTDRHHLQQHADQQRGAEREHGAGDEAAGPGHEGRREIGADHVQRTVREVHHVHDAEDQRQSGRQQEQQQPELQAVEALFEDEKHATCPAVIIREADDRVGQRMHVHLDAPLRGA